MDALELKVPPPVVALVIALAMWSIYRFMPGVDVGLLPRAAAALLLAAIGGAFSAAGITVFRRAKTTMNPMKPEATSALVTNGVYRFTRNPMYVGLLFVLLAWAAALGAPLGLLGPIAFIAYITRFQIVPEERALRAAFGDAYVSYLTQVRRWL
ncbi:protein-S-isoprenylcysteine O-methyltransferase Ste14 [Pelomonas saccharophila]|uniref:Protein-S-isoprenylcysteine O-methyltransferase Ste14 n=1 Tax=Roseateles saccharophilus TaxID=304 RepID=A0ABU1YG73_ROSSA|nr:isoprenylcysteine carboxylmethyltransferase family protein [Roseateles saccharophilus]MDR7267862.1 protein-S-isoprenylcysteine O-methyltransferase Ste14 [Roseateles saccharophilus]